MVRKILALSVLGWATAFSAFAIDTSFQPNAAEMVRMPEFCQVKFKSTRDSPEWKSWRNRLGNNFQDIHHYCVGMNFLNRAWAARDKKDRGFYLDSALGNINYMVKAMQPDFPLRAEVFARRADVYKLMGRQGEAVKDLRQAIEIQPDLVKPYLQLIDYYQQSGKRKDALELATAGLRYNPDSTAMQRRYLDLGGVKPFPEPVQAKASAIGSEPVPATPTEPSPEQAASVSKAPEMEQVPVQPSETKPVIGAPGNPYCRFCPPPAETAR